MATLDEISEAIKLIEQKKQSLQKSFEQLQNHSDSLSLFALTWPQIDAHFSQIQSSLQTRFSLLQSSFPKSEPDPENPFPQNPEFYQNIKEMCQKMQGPKLRFWVKKNQKILAGFINELGMALKWAPDPYKLVLDGIEGVFPTGEANGILLEGLMKVEGVDLSDEVRERGKKLGFEWKEMVFKDFNKYPFIVVGLLRLLCCFRLVEEFSKGDLFQLVYSVAINPKVPEICRALGFDENVPDLVQKLIDNRKQNLAIKFVHEFKLEGKFPPAKLASQYPPSFIEKRVKEVIEIETKENSTLSIQPFIPRMSMQMSYNHHLQAKGIRPAAHANNLGVGFPSSTGLTNLHPSQQSYFRPPISHQYASGSQLPFNSYNMPPVAYLGFPPPHHPYSHP